MKKILILLILLIPLISALDSQTFFLCGGDEQGYFLCIGDSQNDFFGTIPQDQVGGGGSPVFDYSINLNVLDKKVKGNNYVVGNITIINPNNFPGNNLKLIYYIQKNNTKIGYTEETLFNVAPGNTSILKEILIPKGTELGEWEFISIIESSSQESFKSSELFKIIKGSILPFIFGFIFAVFLVILAVLMKQYKDGQIYKEE